MENLDFIPGISAEYEQKMYATVLIIIAVLSAKWMISKVVFRHVEDHSARYYWQKSISITFNILVVILIARIWIEG